MPDRLLGLLLVTAGLATTGCRIAPRIEVAGEVAWTDGSPGKGPGGDEELKVAAGDIVRFEAAHPVRVGEVVRSDEGEAVVWRTLVPEDGVALLRAGLFTTAVRASHEVFRGVDTGAPRKPEFGWFELESDVMHWAAGPVGAPFPSTARAKRFSPAEFAELDEALGGAFPSGAPSERSVQVTEAIRRLAALRAIHRLEGLRGFPYALNWDIDLKAFGPTRNIETRQYVAAEPGKSVPLHVSGPIELFVWARVPRGKVDAEVEVRVTEAGRLRGSTRGRVRREAERDTDGEVDLSQLRHILIHVPPGDHDYVVESPATTAYVSAEISRPASRLENMLSPRWHEGPLLAAAKQACDPSSFAPACALALALSAEEGRPEYARALQQGSDVLRRVADRLAQGGPSDYAADLERRALAGDTAAVSEISEQVLATTDSSFHEAWRRTALRATFWDRLPAEPGAPKWITFVPGAAAGASCDATGGLGSRREVTSEVASFQTRPWRKEHALDLVAIAPCSGDPMRLEVDGRPLVAQPSGPRAIWHVVVKGESAKVRRLDSGQGHVYTTGDDQCSSEVEASAAPQPLDKAHALSFPKDAAAVGLEVWALRGKGEPKLVVHSADGRDSVSVEITPRNGARGLDEQGGVWTRGARVALPDWAKAGVTVEGAATVAVRGLVRRARTAVEPPKSADVAWAAPPDEAALVALSRKIVAAKEPRVRAALLRDRALLLASYGVQTAAVEDAEAARALGGTGPAGEDTVASVRGAVLPVAPAGADLPVMAYGLDPDFDPHAPRCAVAADGPRAEMAALEALLRARPIDAAFDEALAARTLRALAVAPDDPRGASLRHLALRGSRWHVLREVSGGAGRVPRPLVTVRDRLFDPEGHLRPDLAAGHPLGDDHVIVTPDSPARASLTPAGGKARVDVFALSRDAKQPSGTCPLIIAVGDASPRVEQVPTGQVTSVDLPASSTRGHRPLVLSIPAGSPDCTMLARLVFERVTEGTVNVAGVGWVLTTPHVQHRTLVTPARPVRVETTAPEVLRIDARPEGGATPEVVAEVDGKEVTVPLQGEPLVVAAAGGSPVVVSVRSGEATVVVAQRVAAEREASAPVAESKAQAHAPPQASALALDLAAGTWRQTAKGSPRPLTWLEDRLGTIEADTGVTAANVHEGATASGNVDAYFYEDLMYRRRVEAPNLYTFFGASARLRDGPPTLAGEAGFYEDLDRYRMRITGTATGFTQTVQDQVVQTLEASGFVEYSGRIRPDFFILPRLGYDGYYTNLAAPPPASVTVDDDVYDPFRFVRNTIMFLQGLFWYCPHFNDIYYLRVRANFDVGNGAFSHAAVTPGVLLIFHQAELQLTATGAYYEATQPVRMSAGFEGTAYGELIWHAVVLPGSFELRPNIQTEIKLNDGSWQLSAGVNILAAARRGMRDYSSLELEFPEETAGGVPWRDESRVGP